LGIPIGGKKHRRSYADYKPPPKSTRPKDDWVRVLVYATLIMGCLYLIRNPDSLRQQITLALPEQSAPVIGPTPTATTSPDLFVAQAQDAYASGHLDKAVEFYRQAAEISPNNVEYHFQVARLLLFESAMQYGNQRDQTLKDALDAANRTILADPERPEGYAIMGKVLDWSDRPDDASSQILRALELDKKNPLVLSYMAESMVDLDRWEQAQQTIAEAIAIDPNNLDIRRDNAYILESLGDYYGASVQYEDALKINPNIPFIRMALGRAYRVIGRNSEALDQFFAVDTLQPENPLIQHEIGRTYETWIGDPNSALEYYKRAVELDEKFPGAWVRLGIIYFFQNEYDQAITAFERAMKLGVEDPEIETYLGLAYANQGDCVKAIQHLQKVQPQVQNDQRLADLVLSGFKLCQQTPVPLPTSTP
jgi:tetratricopeptide (TPR) repeat protein